MTIQEAREQLLGRVQDLVSAAREGQVPISQDGANRITIDGCAKDLVRACALCADHFVTAGDVYALEHGLPPTGGFVGMPGDAILSAAGLK